MEVKHRRDQPSKRTGTGRVTTRREFIVPFASNTSAINNNANVGRRTGLQINKDINKDEYGLENLQDYWSDGEASADAPAKKRISFRSSLASANTSSSSPRESSKRTSLVSARTATSSSSSLTSSEEEQEEDLSARKLVKKIARDGKENANPKGKALLFSNKKRVSIGDYKVGRMDSDKERDSDAFDSSEEEDDADTKKRKNRRMTFGSLLGRTKEPEGRVRPVAAASPVRFSRAKVQVTPPKNDGVLSSAHKIDKSAKKSASRLNGRASAQKHGAGSDALLGEEEEEDKKSFFTVPTAESESVVDGKVKQRLSFSTAGDLEDYDDDDHHHGETAKGERKRGEIPSSKKKEVKESPIRYNNDSDDDPLLADELPSPSPRGKSPTPKRFGHLRRSSSPPLMKKLHVSSSSEDEDEEQEKHRRNGKQRQEQEEEEEDEEDVKFTPQPRHDKRKRMYKEEYDDDEYDDDDDDDYNYKTTERRPRRIEPVFDPRKDDVTPGVRRSKRRRWLPLEHWRGERLVIQRGPKEDQVALVLGAEKPVNFMTPKPPKRRKKKMKPKQEPGEKPVLIPNDIEFCDPDTPLKIKDDKTGEVLQHIIVRDRRDVTLDALSEDTETKFRESTKSKKTIPAGQVSAGAAFDSPYFISGIMDLPPLSSKPLENPGSYNQSFYVSKAQEESLVVSIGGQFYKLSPGDHFWVPSNTNYGLQNYSRTTDAQITFCLLKPNTAPAPVASSSSK